MIPVTLPDNYLNLDLGPLSPDAMTIYQAYNRTVDTGENRTLSDGSIRTLNNKITGHPELARVELPPQLVSVEI